MRYQRFPLSLAVALLTALAACKDTPPPDDQQQHIKDVVAAGGVVDSILPIPVLLDRFRKELTEQPDTLRHASASMKDLVARWAASITASDTSEFNHMMLDRAEFAWLYYPDSKMSKPPYEAPPQLLWGQMLATTNEGAQALLRNFGGKRITVEGIRCPQPATAEGRNLLHEGCLLQMQVAGKREAERAYFGTIIERDKRFKFVSYANKL